MQLSAEITAGRQGYRSDILGLVSARIKFGLSCELGIWEKNPTLLILAMEMLVQHTSADKTSQRLKVPELLAAQMTKLKLREFKSFSSLTAILESP